MSASATDKFQKVSIATATTLDAPGYTIGDTSITVASTSTWPTDTGITFAIDEVDANGDRVAGSYNEYVGVVSTGTSITSVSHVNGTNRNYTAGTTSRVYIPVSEERENRLAEGILVHADQDGTLKAGAVDGAAVLASNVVTTAKILDANVTTAKIADGAVTNAKLSTTAGDIGGSWETWTPTFSSGFTLGNGTMVAKKTKIGKTVKFRIKVTLGTTSALTPADTAVIVSLPSTSVSDVYTAAGTVIGTVEHNDASASTVYPGGLLWLSTTSAQLTNHAIATTYARLNRTDANDPMVWATGDSFTIYGEYEEA